ncbi:MAG: M4 family metallopeptidase [Chitinophagales bacterium]|nr:M4 family metallopeptidase [Chitinophagales bacterium]
MKKIFLKSKILLGILIAAGVARAQEPLSQELLQHKTFGRFLKADSKKDWISFKDEAPYNAVEIFKQQPELIGLKSDDQMKLMKTRKDAAGNSHYRFAQLYKGVRIELAEYLVHEKKSKVYLINGDFIPNLNLDVQPTISNEQAIDAALKAVPAQKYLWEDARQEENFKKKKNDLNATLYPQPELLIVKNESRSEKAAVNYSLAYRVAVFAQIPLRAEYVYVDAKTGNILRTRSLDIFCSGGTVNTTFNGSQTVNTTYMTDASDYTGEEHTAYFTMDDCNPDTEIKSWYADNFSGDYLKFDTDNDWQSSGSTKMTITSLWGIKKAYSYYYNVRGHESFDGSDGLIDIFNNRIFEDDDDNEYCSNASYTNILDNINVGAGADCSSGTTDDYNTVDILGHEYTHGVIEYAHFDALDYSDESGALNESFADIFGEVIEDYVEGSNDWFSGADKSDGALRSYADPKSKGDPDTYFGENWATLGGNDNGGVHTNSNVQNHMFFLLSEGGSGTNDVGWDYNVTGIGLGDASDIAWQAMMEYLDGDDGYYTARNAWIQSAIDLFGSCSQQVISVGEAWMAAGVTHYTAYNLGSICGTYSSIFPTTIDAAEEIRNASILFNEFSLNCTATVISPAIVTLESGNIIQLFPGFTATSGSVFTALIDKCEQSDYDPNNVRQSENITIENNNSSPSIHIYPNPADDFATVAFAGSADQQLKLYVSDVTGKRKWEGERELLLPNDKFTVQIISMDFVYGFYLCVIQSGDKVFAKKFLVQHE